MCRLKYSREKCEGNNYLQYLVKAIPQIVEDSEIRIQPILVVVRNYILNYILVETY